MSFKIYNHQSSIFTILLYESAYYLVRVYKTHNSRKTERKQLFKKLKVILKKYNLLVNFSNQFLLSTVLIFFSLSFWSLSFTNLQYRLPNMLKLN